MMKMVDADQVTAGQRAVLERQVSRIERLISDLVDVSRIELGKIKLQRELTELNGLIEHAVENARPGIDHRHQRLIVEMSRMPLYIEADAARIMQAVDNIMVNASLYSDDGGSIALKVEQEQDQAVIRIRDDGIGIPPDQLEKIFERFVQLEPSMERAASGLGIGLTLAKTLIELHGGSVAAASEGVGKGSEFTIRLRLAPKPVLVPRAVDADADVPHQIARRILVADDNADAAESLALILRLRGHQVRTADHGQAAIEVAAEFRPEVVILDLGMPKINGYDAARHIRWEQWGKNVLLIALSGWGQPDDRQRSVEAGFDHHLTKPADLQELATIIDRHSARLQAGPVA